MTPEQIVETTNKIHQSLTQGKTPTAIDMAPMNVPFGEVQRLIDQVQEERSQGTQTAVAVIEPQQTQLENAAEHLTEKEATEIVQRWVTQDDEVEISERRTFEEMVEELGTIKALRPPISDISASRLKQIVQKYAPNAPHRTDEAKAGKDVPGYPVELASLVASGAAFSQDGFWLTKRCTKCGQFKTKCCGPLETVSVVRQDERTLTSIGRQAVGLDPIKPPKPPKTVEQIAEERKQTWHQESWWRDFSGTSELQGNTSVKMLIENFLPEGLTLICGLPKEGKSFLALSVAKALTSGKPLFGRPGFEVPEPVPVLYLAAESGDSALKLRCERMNITKDKTQFICRTLSMGLMLGLEDPTLEQAIKAMKPVVILETLIRFNDGTDEDSSTQNRKLAESLFRLIGWGAQAVIGIHHSRKDLNKANPTKEAAVRGSGDGLAMVDCAWLIMQDEKLFQGGKGPNEVDLIGWGRDFNPVPIRLALTKKAPKLPAGTITYAPGIVSCIESGDFEWVDRHVRETRVKEFAQLVEQLVTEFPTITLKDLAAKSERKQWEVRKALKGLGYRRGQGDNSTTQWEKTAG